ncbi:MAG TPA: hypothetical protein VGC08_14420 [Pedobacter sp.]
MRRFSIAVNGQNYQVTELNKKSGLYELCRNGITHIIGKSQKTGNWLYIRKSPFSPLLPIQEAIRAMEQFINGKGVEKNGCHNGA